MGLPKSAMQGILGGLLQGVDEHAQATIEQNRKQAEEQYAVHKQNLEGIIKSMRENPNTPTTHGISWRLWGISTPSRRGHRRSPGA